MTASEAPHSPVDRRPEPVAGQGISFVPASSPDRSADAGLTHNARPVQGRTPHKSTEYKPNGRKLGLRVAALDADILSAGRARRSGTEMYRSAVKRMIDILLIVLAAPIVLPLIGVLALLVARDGGQPFYCQSRIGRNGRVYRMWKLRTMVQDADARLEACLAADPAMRNEWDAKQKLLDDPRITSLGRFLRKSSIDELPQLWNVLIGDMSLVGPRPMMVSQQALYPGQDYYELRPGITGLWQISDRNASTFADRAKFDAVYNRVLSMPTDLGILLATVRVVLRGTGH